MNMFTVVNESERESSLLNRLNVRDESNVASIIRFGIEDGSFQFDKATLFLYHVLLQQGRHLGEKLSLLCLKLD